VVTDVEPDDLISIVPAIRKLGVEMVVADSSVRVPAGQRLLVEDDFGGQIPKIESGVWPAFPADLTSIAVTVATQATGTILIFEKMFESRLFFVDKLVSMGRGSSSATRIASSSPARDALRRAPREPGHPRGHGDAHRALCAEGTSTIGNIRQIDRGTSASTSACASSAPRSSAPSCDERGAARIDLAGRAVRSRPGSPSSTTCSRSSARRRLRRSLEIAPDDPEAEVDARARRSATLCGRCCTPRARVGESGSRPPTKRSRWS
jgi:hypothetical protein